MIDACAAVCAEHDKQLVVGAGTNSTAKTVAAVEALAGTPALAATLIVVPYYVRPSEAGVIAHFRAVADASPVPVVVYNIPIRTGRNLGPAGMLYGEYTLGSTESAEEAASPQRAFLRSRANSIEGGTTEVMKNILGERVLGPPGDVRTDKEQSWSAVPRN